MAEEIVVPPTETPTEVPVVNPFSEGAWQNEEKPAEAPAAPAAPETPETPVVPEPPKEDESGVKSWLKRELDVDDADILKQQIKEYREYKEKPVEEIQFGNEQSKRVYDLIREGKYKEVREALEKHEKLESMSAAEITAETAANIIKAGMQLKYADLTVEEVEHKFNKMYSTSKKPVQSENEEDELDEDYQKRMIEWKVRNKDVTMDMIIEAKLIRPEIIKAREEFKFPEANAPNEADQKLLADARGLFLERLKSDYGKVDGYGTKVKDELVEIPVQFTIPDVEKGGIKKRLEDGFNVNDFVDKRWFDDKNVPKIDVIVKDIYALENLDKILSGVANNAAAKRMEAFHKTIKNTDLKHEQPYQETYQENGKRYVNPYADSSWSDKPIVNN
jgi:hypothetical protein